MGERYHSFGRVLKDLALDREQLLRLVQLGYLRAFQDRKRLVFRRDDVEAFRQLREGGLDLAGVAAGEAEGSDADETLHELGITTDSDPASSVFESLPESAIRPRLGAILKRAGIVTEGEIQEALARQTAQRSRGELVEPFGQHLLHLGYITETELINSLGIQAGLEIIDLDHATVPPEAVRALPLQVSDEFGVVPVRVDPDGSLVVACSEPQNLRLSDDLAVVLGRPVKLAVAVRANIDDARRQLYAGVVPEALEPVRTPSGRLRVDKIDESLRWLARDASEAMRRWYAEPGNPHYPPQVLGPRVFLAMPFDRRFDPVADLVVRSVGELGGRPLRIDQVSNLRNIWMAIEREIARADVVIADFTGDVNVDVPNPNVVTEAAIAFHKYEKPVIVVTQSTKGLFFDWRHQFALVYTLDHEGLLRLGRGLTNRLAAEFNLFRGTAPAVGNGAGGDPPESASASYSGSRPPTEPNEPV